MGNDGEQVALLRGGSQVSSLLGAFGRGLRETRLTAFLGYLIAQQPESFRDLLGFDGDVGEVGLETTEDGGRTDILIDTPRGRCVVEAKVTASDPHKQAHRYDARWRVVLSSLASTAGRGKRIRYVSWQKLADHLTALSKEKAQPFKGLCLELVHHLEEHRMIRVDPVEIYAREINNEVTLSLFLHARVYTCAFERGSRLGEAMYFAPHFGAHIARLHPGVNQGISYIAKVEDVGVANSWKETHAYILQHRGKVWYG